MDKGSLTSRKHCIHAVFDKMPVLEAKINTLNINDLDIACGRTAYSDQAYSYKFSSWGISHQTDAPDSRIPVSLTGATP